MSARLEVPDAVLHKARAVGVAGERWLLDLDQIVSELETEWGLRAGAAFTGGSGGYVANAVTADGTAAVLKIAIPDGLEGHQSFASELRSLAAGRGHGYVRVLRSDLARRAMLQERLGRPLSALNLAVEAQIDITVATLRRGWDAPLTPDPGLPTGAEQAAWLIEFIRTRWEQLSHPAARCTVDLALQYARSRCDAFDPSNAVLIHGDAHPANVLEDPNPTAPRDFKLIDPDAMVSEPAHDLAIPLRDWSGELSAGDPVALGRAWCARLSARADVDQQAVWEWAFVERVSTGLFLLQLGEPEGAQLLRVADRWAEADAP